MTQNGNNGRASLCSFLAIYHAAKIRKAIQEGGVVELSTTDFDGFLASIENSGGDFVKSKLKACREEAAKRAGGSTTGSSGDARPEIVDIPEMIGKMPAGFGEDLNIKDILLIERPCLTAHVLSKGSGDGGCSMASTVEAGKGNFAIKRATLSAVSPLIREHREKKKDLICIVVGGGIESSDGHFYVAHLPKKGGTIVKYDSVGQPSMGKKLLTAEKAANDLAALYYIANDAPIL